MAELRRLLITLNSKVVIYEQPVVNVLMAQYALGLFGVMRHCHLLSKLSGQR